MVEMKRCRSNGALLWKQGAQMFKEKKGDTRINIEK